MVSTWFSTPLWCTCWWRSVRCELGPSNRRWSWARFDNTAWLARRIATESLLMPARRRDNRDLTATIGRLRTELREQRREAERMRTENEALREAAEPLIHHAPARERFACIHRLRGRFGIDTSVRTKSAAADGTRDDSPSSAAAWISSATARLPERRRSFGIATASADRSGSSVLIVRCSIPGLDFVWTTRMARRWWRPPADLDLQRHPGAAVPANLSVST